MITDTIQSTADPITLIQQTLERAQIEPVPCAFISGSAGCGKTYSVKKLIADNPSLAILASTTGISAINLNAVTINSLLKYFDTANLTQKAIHNKIVPLLKQIALTYSYICLDEVSMMEAEQLDIIYDSIAQLNDQSSMQGRKLGLIAVGDFCQLSPVKGKYAFESECWQAFDRNTVKLTKIWRQSDIHFINALNYLRSGDGERAASTLVNDCGVQFHKEIDLNFNGTTVFAKNQQVDTFNGVRFRELTGARYELQREVKGFPIKEWDKIPESLPLKIGAYVMILANQYEQGFELNRKMIYSNGDCGYIEEVEGSKVMVRLVRNDEVVGVNPVTRYNTAKDEPKPSEWNYPTDGFKPQYREKEKDWILGQVTYIPLRLAYASSNHKTQGLSLDNVQISFADRFFGSNSMLYVAVSRARTLEGLRLVGTPPLMRLRCNIDEKIRRFL